VTCRNRELGIRAALGARRARVLGMVISEGVALAVVGVVLGTCGALLTSRALGGLLYEVDPQDPLTVAATALGFLALALTASLVPAHRATRVDPVEVLKAE
jgi:putative ABC transport system permease protein